MSKAAIVSGAVCAAVVAAAFALNPSPERHRAKIREVVAERSPIAGMLGMGALTAFVSNYHSLGVASYTSVEDRTLSFGFLGMVFVMDNSKGK